jgi:sorting nexin-25
VLYSKYAAVGMEIAIFLSTMFCMFVMPKYALIHHNTKIKYRLAALLGLKQRKEHYRELLKSKLEKAEKETETDDAKDRMVSVDMYVSLLALADVSILIVNLIVTTPIVLTWYFADGVYLRFVMIGMGTMSALYALWDVVIDGVIHGRRLEGSKEFAESGIKSDKDASDCALMAHEFNLHVSAAFPHG